MKCNWRHCPKEATHIAQHAGTGQMCLCDEHTAAARQFAYDSSAQIFLVKLDQPKKESADA